ncbi:putative ribosomal-protein-alanine N-acetyltransferase [Erwinia phage vB_EamM_Phobos]|uniref:acetyltransferase n=1 Tax=Erwinia phage vB_EamM_Phobos TaxID=1883377 RepID=UPI00081C81D6|nr:acetyltransferase [Erwinia phage vB_EamM_Phobos]ANZ50287.1 putative ribosomal-protein-alanine N-acetyltransferase [Erwinia phage vB_EamM_Phobos]
MDEIQGVEFVVFTDRDSGLYLQLEPQMLEMEADLIKQELLSMMTTFGLSAEGVSFPPVKPDWWKNTLLVAYNDERVHGFISLREEVSTQGKIYNLYVHPQSRGYGIASELIARAETMAKEMGYDTVCLEVMHDNPVAEALYSKQGYKMLTRKMSKLI